jgi:hypothetical protein
LRSRLLVVGQGGLLGGVPDNFNTDTHMYVFSTVTFLDYVADIAALFEVTL